VHTQPKNASKHLWDTSIACFDHFFICSVPCICPLRLERSSYAFFLLVGNLSPWPWRTTCLVCPSKSRFSRVCLVQKTCQPTFCSKKPSPRAAQGRVLGEDLGAGGSLPNNATWAASQWRSIFPLLWDHTESNTHIQLPKLEPTATSGPLNNL